MADVSGKFFSAKKVRTGVSPSSPGVEVGETLPPVNPPGGALNSVGLTMPSAFTVSNSPLTANGTIGVAGAGTISQYVRGDGSLETFPSLTGFVPYTGATQNVDLGEFGIDAGFVNLDTTPTGTPTTQGTIFWDSDDETVDIVLNGYTMKIGEDLFYPVKNQTGSTIAKGVAVRFAGTLGASGRLLIEPFIANGTVPSSRFMGVTAEEILNGDDGKVLYFGRVRGINTDAFNEGDILYASTTVAGGYQTAIPLPPNNIVQIAAVISKSATVGTIFVRPTLGSNINTDEGVKITSVADKDLLQYQSGTGLWENKSRDAAGVVTTDTAQTITGSKTFSSDITVNGVNVGRGGSSVGTNTRFGTAALGANTTGNANTANGAYALENNTTGSDNTAVGQNALESNTTANGNTAIGFSALQSNTTGESNTAVGRNALRLNTAGNSNTAFGWEALSTNTVFGANTAVGNQALRFNTGGQNTAIGFLALFENTTGENNTALGESALLRNTTGSNNIAIGNDSGSTTPSGQNTTGSNSIFIGGNTMGAANNQTNQIVIGHNAIGNGSNTVTIGNDSITNTYLKGAVTLTGALNGTSIGLSGDITANRYRGVNSLVLNSYTTVNPSSNVYLYSPPNDRDAWIYLDSADTGSNWGIYHRQIDSVVGILPGNSIAFVGGGDSTLQAYVHLISGDGYFRGNLSAANLSGTNTGNVTIGTANGLSLSGQVLSLGLASGSTNGALSSTDWTTFNNKQAAGNYVTTDTTQTITGQKTISKVATNFNGTVQSFLIDGAGNNGALTINSQSIGYSYQTFAQGGVGKFEIGIVGTSGNGSLYINRNIQTGETGASIFIKKSDGFVGINNINPLYQLDINGETRVFKAGDNWHFVIDGGTGQLRFGAETSGGAVIQARTEGGTARPIFLQRDGNNVIIGGTSDNGARLQVSGTANITGTIFANTQLNNTVISPSDATNITNGFNLLGSQSYWGIRTTTAGNFALDVYGAGSTRNALTILQASGNVLIGTTTDNGQRLQVNGSIRSGFANTSALLVQSNGTATTGAAIAIQQLTGEGDTIIFGDYEPFAEYGIIARNSLDAIDFTGGTTNGSLDNYNITNRSGNVRTAYVKARIGLGSGITAFGGNVLIGTTTSTGAKLEINGDIRTGALDGGYVSGFWKLGRALSGSQPSETHQIIVEINGALYSVGAAAL